MEKKSKKKSKKKVIIIIAIIIAIICGVIFFKTHSSNDEKSVTMIETKASIGTIQEKVSGSGTVEPYERYEISSLVQGEILTAPFEEGATVKKDDVLYTIDSSNAQSSVRKAQNSISKARVSNKNTEENIQNLTITATQDGYISNLNINVGDEINSNYKVANITDTSNMTLTVSFAENQISNIYVGQTVDVLLIDYMSYTQGTVTHISNASRTISDGTTVYDVEVQAVNPGAVVNGAKASVTAGGEKSITVGNVEIKTVTLSSKASGEVTNVYVKNNDKVTAGQVIATLKNEDYYNTKQQNDLNMSDLYQNLQDAYDTLDNYTIKSPIDGVVITKNKKAGDKIGNSSSSNSNSTSTLMVVADISKMKFTMNVDELDISNIAVGQEVQITADAIANQKFTGRISTIPAEGSTSNGVTTYAVEVVIDEPGNLKTGMNVTAEVIIQEAENVLLVPMSAVTQIRGKLYAYVKSGTADETVEPINKNIPSGYVLKEITVGMSNDEYIEVKGGLSEGDSVYSMITSSSNSSMQSMMGMPGGGMMSGGGTPPQMGSGEQRQFRSGSGSGSSSGGFPSSGSGSRPSGMPSR